MKFLSARIYLLGFLILRSYCAVLKTVSSQDLKFVIKANEYLLVVFVSIHLLMGIINDFIHDAACVGSPFLSVVCSKNYSLVRQTTSWDFRPSIGWIMSDVVSNGVEPDCQPCKDAEVEIGQLATSILDSLIEVTFVRVASTDIPEAFGITNKPVIIFYRHTKPLIYDGLPVAAEIEEWISQNRETALKTLTDENFEHLTQAATGSTTGDWLVSFCDSALKSCQNLQPVFETLASKFSGQQNVAYVDTSTNPLLVKRFSLKKDLTFLFFRLGKMYEYSIDKIDIASLTSFAHGWYKNLESKSVPVPPSPFDQLVTEVVQILKQHYVIVWAGLACIALVFLLMLFWRRPTASQSRKMR